MSRFDYIAYDTTAQEQQAALKAAFQRLEALVLENMKPGRAQALVLTKLEEAYMWTGKGIRDQQIERNGEAPLQEGRSNG